MPIIPATKVLLRAASPYVASTVREDISFNLVGSEPEFISSTNDVASSVVKLPWIITSLAKALSTLAADKHLDVDNDPHLSFSLLNESLFSS